MTKNKNAVIEDYVYSELTVQQICSKYGISSKTISKIIAEANVPSRAMTSINSAIYKAFKNGVTVEDLSIKYNVADTKIKKVISAERKRSIIAEYNQGLAVKKVAQNNDVNITYVYQVLKSTNVTLRQPQKAKRDNRKLGYNVEAVIADYADKTIRVSDIYQKHKISSSTLRSILAKNNIPLRQISKVSTDKQRNILSEYSSGLLSINEVAEKYSVSASTVRNIIENNHIQNIDPFNQMDRLIKEYSKSLRSVAFFERKYNIPRFAIEKAIKNSNANKKREKLIKKAIEKYHNGISAGQIADELGISRSKFYRLIQTTEVSHDEQN